MSKMPLRSATPKSLKNDDCFVEIDHLSVKSGDILRIESRQGPSQYDGADIRVMQVEEKTAVVESKSGGASAGLATSSSYVQVKCPTIYLRESAIVCFIIWLFLLKHRSRFHSLSRLSGSVQASSFSSSATTKKR